MMVTLPPGTVCIPGADFFVSKKYKGRYEVMFYMSRGKEIKNWIRDTFGESDPLVHAIDENNQWGYESLISPEQLTLVCMKWTNNENW